MITIHGVCVFIRRAYDLLFGAFNAFLLWLTITVSVKVALMFIPIWGSYYGSFKYSYDTKYSRDNFIYSMIGFIIGLIISSLRGTTLL